MEKYLLDLFHLFLQEGKKQFVEAKRKHVLFL